MAAKFERHKNFLQLSDSPMKIPRSYRIKVDALRVAGGARSEFYMAILDYLDLQSVFARIKQLKLVVLMLKAASSKESEEDCVPLLVVLCELFFVEHSLQMTRAILSAIRTLHDKNSARQLRVIFIVKFFFNLDHPEYDAKGEIMVQLILTSIRNSNEDSRGNEIALHGAAVVALLECNAAHDWLGRTAPELCIHFCSQLQRVFASDSPEVVHPSILEDAQDVMTSLYSLVHKHAPQMVEKHGEKGREAVQSIGQTMLMLLQGDRLAKEVMTSAGATLFTVLDIPRVGEPHKVFALIQGLFLAQGSLLKFEVPVPEGYGERELSILERYLSIIPSNLIDEFYKFSTFGRIGATRALVSGGRHETLCAQLDPVSSTSSSACLLTIALEYLCLELTKPSDSQIRFHLLSALVYCLQRVQTCVRNLPMESGNVGEEEETVDEQRGQQETDESSTGLENELLCMSIGVDDDSDGAADSCHDDETSFPALCTPFINKDTCDVLVDVLWRHIEESEAQTDFQALEAFRVFLDILGMQKNIHNDFSGSSDLPVWDVVIENIAHRLTDFGDGKKGKYNLLSAILPHTGSNYLLNLVPDLMMKIFKAFEDPSISRAASQFLKVLLTHVLAENKEDPGGVGGLEKWRLFWTELLVHGLTSSSMKTQSNLANYVVPIILELDEMSLAYLVGRVLKVDDSKGECSFSGKLSGLLALLKVGRKRLMVPNLDAIVDNPGCIINVPSNLLKSAVFHSSVDVRVSVLELACIHPKGTDLPDKIDLEIVLHCARIGFRATGLHARHKWIDLFNCFIERTLVALHAKMIGSTQRIEYKRGGRSKDRAKSVSPMACAINTTCGAPSSVTDVEEEELEKSGIRRTEAFFQEFTRTCITNLYPGGPVQRQVMAVDLLRILFDNFSKETWITWPSGTFSSIDTSHDRHFQAFCPALLEHESVQILMGVAVNAWDHLRSGVIDCLMHFPTPLPGFSIPSQVSHLLKWITNLVQSPRLRESDSGARLLMLIYEKYVCKLGWGIVWDNGRLEAAGEEPMEPFEASIVFLRSLWRWLEESNVKGEQDLLAQCKEGLAHGVLVALRYAFQLNRWTNLSSEQAGEVHQLLKCLVPSLKRCSDLCLTILSDQTMCSMTAEDIEAGDVPDLNPRDSADLGPTARILTTGTWLTMKEVSSMMGTLATLISVQGEDMGRVVRLLDESHVEIIRSHFTKTLIDMKHNGAVEKTGNSFKDVCSHLFHCPEPEKRGLPSVWMDLFFARILEVGQSRDDIVRKSSGIPFGFDAIFRAEPYNAPKVLLPKGLSRLISIGSDSSLEPWPRVHAFNSLTHVFNDKALAADAQAFFADGMCSCITGLSDTYWEIRNAAALCFTALTTRMVGYKNVAASGTSRKSISAFEFFARYPSLHTFLDKKMLEASKQLSGQPGQVPPSLAPMLLLLARLLPSVRPPTINMTDILPSVLIPAVEACVGTQHMAVRQLAARALVPLVSTDKVHEYISASLTEIPKGGKIFDSNGAHGCLLTLRTMLQVREDISVRKINPDFFLSIEEQQWLMDNSEVSAGIRLEYVRIISTIFSKFSDAEPMMRRLGPMVVQRLDAVIHEARRWDMSLDPLVPAWLKECTTLRFMDEILQYTDLKKENLRCLNNGVYEVQVAELKLLTRRLRCRGVDSVVLSWIQEAACEELMSDQNPKVLRRILELMTVAIPFCMEEEGNVEFAAEAWEAVAHVLKKCSHLTVRARALECLGVVGKELARIHGLQGSVHLMEDYMHKFKDLVLAYSSSHSSLDVRLATVKMLGHSGFLQIPHNVAPDSMISVWAAALELMEDDDESVRHQCSEAVACSLRCLNEGSEWNEGVHVEVVEREAFRIMVNKYGGHVSMISRLLNWIVEPSASSLKLLKDSPGAIFGETHKLFDKEINQHAEPLLRSQLAAYHLSSLLHEASDQTLKIVESWISEIADLLQAFQESVSLTLGSLGDETNFWVGGVTYLPDIFVALYQALLGFWALRNSPELLEKIQKNCLTALFDLVSTRSLSLHPMLAYLVHVLTSKSSSGSTLIWFEGCQEVFDPYFLRTL